MRNTIIGTLMLLLASLSTGCALRVVHPIPQSGPVMLPAPRRAPPRVEHRQVRVPLSHRQAVALGADYCADRGYDCRLDKATLTKNGNVWKVHFDARSWRAKGKVHLELDSYSGRILQAKEKGQLGKRRHG